MYCICVLEDIEFVSFYDCSIGEVMYCICVLEDIEFVSFYDCSIGEVMYCICVLEDIESLSTIVLLEKSCTVYVC